MKKQRLLLMLVPLLLMAALVSAQKRTITGKVLDGSTGTPLAGVSILANKEAAGIASKEDGTFSISLSSNAKSLMFSYIGYTNQTVQIGSQTNLVINLKPEPASQSEVVVVGYGTQKRATVSGAVSKFQDENLNQAPVSRLDQALQGRIAGVNIQNVAPEAGADPKISIRGISSIYAGASPLIVVDGQPIPDGLKYINPGDVASVEVLKDAASAAIYGSRGASGVILITTKKGASGKTKYVFNYSVGQKEASKRYDVMTTKDYVGLLFNEMALRAQDPSVVQSTNTVVDADRASYVIEDSLMKGKGTDWQSEALRPGLFQNIDLSATGGTKNAYYFVSGSYKKDEGMMIKSNYETFNIRARLDLELSSRVKLAVIFNPSYTKRQAPTQNFTNFWRTPSWLPVTHDATTANFVHLNPLYPNVMEGDFAHLRQYSNIAYSGKMPDGSYWTSTGLVSPSGSAQQNPKSSVLTSDNNTNDYRLQTSADLTINLLPGLNFRSLASIYMNYANGLNFTERNSNSDGSNNIGVFTNNTYTDMLSENMLNYMKHYKEHDFTVLVGMSAQRTNITKDQTTGLSFPSDDIRTLNSASQIDKSGTSGTRNQIGLNSYFGRITYAYMSKYLLSASLRKDGSSYFGPGNKWGSFPAISVGWVASKEKFLKDISWLSNLKFRASYGLSGNNRIVDFAYLNLLYGSNYSLGSGTGVSNPGLVNSTINIATPNITWERTKQTNFGMDLLLFKNKIQLTVDIYQSKTERLLLNQSAQSFTGVPQFWNNNGSLQNDGYEIELVSRNISNKDFGWVTYGNFSHNQNKILELGSESYLLNQGERTEVYKNQVGSPLVQFFGFKTDGVWLSQQQITDAQAKGLTSPLSGVFVPGGLKLVDLNGDGIIDNNDRTNIGSPYPNFTWGLTNEFKYKGFELRFTIQGSHGGQLINGDPNYNESRRVIRTYNENRWVSPLFPGDGKTPYSTNGFNWMLTDYVVESASYWSLREINLGYKIPSKIMSKINLNGARIYVAAQNLYFHSAKGYRGLNPEGRFQNGPYSSSLIDGYQRGIFPTPKTITIGLAINF
jgi:TonB-linked SusC/RagA family outer membrane protein